MKKLTGTIILVAAWLVAPAEASEYWTSCDSCSDRQERRTATLAVPDGLLGGYDVYVADFGRETVRKYQVYVLYDPEHRRLDRTAMRRTTEAHIEYEFVQAVQAIKADIASLAAGKLIPEEVVPSAFDMVHSAVDRQRIADYINDNLSIWETIGAPTSVPLQLLGKIVDLKLTISVIFSDGSTAKFMLSGVEGTLFEFDYLFELVEGSAKDADGNLIPVTDLEAAPYQGVFSEQRFAEQMMDFIVTWYARTPMPRIECRAEAISDSIVVTCKRI